MKAAIIGSTGVVGREVKSLLIKNENISEIVCFNRKDIIDESKKVRNIKMNFDEINLCDKWLVDVDFFFSCLGTTKSQAGSVKLQRIVDLDYQYEFALLAKKMGIKNYALVSSPGADSKSLSPYLKMKGELDEKVKELEFDSTIILRPSLIQGERSDFRIMEKIGIGFSRIYKYVPGMKKYRAITGLQIAKKMILECLKNRYGIFQYELEDLWLTKEEVSE